MYIKQLGGSTTSIKDEEYGLISNIQAYFINTKLITKPMDNDNKLTVFSILEKIRF